MTRSDVVVRVICASGMVATVGCGRVAPGLDHWRSSTPDASAGSDNTDTGGRPSRGTGGMPSIGGRIDAGGTTSTGGRIDTGGTLSTGGRIEAGGTTSTGGVMDTGGTTSTGGVMDTGGTTSTGGVPDTGGTGGVTDTGGTASTGGAVGSGGSEVDGSAGAGGSPVTDGSVSSGGSRDSGVPDSSLDGADARSERDASGTLLPVAVSAGHWEWQGAQRRVLLANGAICASKIAIAVGGRGACFEDSDDDLECTGSVHTHDFGTAFVKTGIRNVDQVLLSGGQAMRGDDLCAHSSTILNCFGANAGGKLGTGDAQPVPDPTPWGGRTDVVAFATGSWNNVCVLDQQGSIHCAGTAYGATPVPYGQTAGQTSFWMSTSDTVMADDSTILRADQSRTNCRVTTLGLVCTSTRIAFGTPGSVVMGGWASVVDPFALVIGAAACWLESSGDVYCGVKGSIAVRDTQMQVFPGRPALALATQYYSNEICAVFADGAVECVRVAIDKLSVTLVASAPPGTAMIGCP